MHLWFLPRALVQPHLPAGRVPQAVQLSGAEGVGGILLSYLNGLSEQMTRLSAADANAVSDNLCRLVAVACGGAAGEQRSALRAARLEEAKAYIGRRPAGGMPGGADEPGGPVPFGLRHRLRMGLQQPADLLSGVPPDLRRAPERFARRQPGRGIRAVRTE